MREKDPITLRPIKTKIQFLRCERWICFDATSLAAYVTATGDVHDPITREPLTSLELKRLARLAGTEALSLSTLQRRRDEQVELRMLTFFLLDDILLHEQLHHEYATDTIDCLREMLKDYPDDLECAIRFLCTRGIPVCEQ